MIKINFSDTIKFSYESTYVLNYDEQTKILVITIGPYSFTLNARHIMDYYEITMVDNVYHVEDCDGNLTITRITPTEEQLELDLEHAKNS